MACTDSSIQRLFRTPAYTGAKSEEILLKLKKIRKDINSLKTELCCHIETTGEPISYHNLKILKWVLQSPFEPQNLTEKTQLQPLKNDLLIEVGPRFNFSTSQSTNSVSICQSLGLTNVVRLEVSRRYLIGFTNDVKVTNELESNLTAALHDRMTECRYTEANIPKKSFNEKLVKRENMKEVDVLNEGKKALKEIDAELGLAFDEADLDYYTNLFKNILKRNPTSVECFDLAQSNSEHSRHWFFKGKMIIDGIDHEESLIDMIIATQKNTNPNNVIKFSDNSR